MDRPFIFFDFGGTLTVEDTVSVIDPDDQLYHRLHGYFTIDSEVLLDKDRFKAQVKQWLVEEKQRRSVSEEEKHSLQMWSEILEVSADTDHRSFPDESESASVALETEGVVRSLRDGVHEVLADLTSRGYGLGIISNVNTRTRVLQELDQFNLTRWFDPIILSSHYGWRKPNPAIFHHASSLAGMPTGKCWYVGDTVSRDILGSRRAGYAGIIRVAGTNDLVAERYTRKFPPEFFSADAVIESFRELPHVLDTLQSVEQRLPPCRSLVCSVNVIMRPGFFTREMTNTLRDIRRTGTYLAIAGCTTHTLQEVLDHAERHHAGDIWDSVHVSHEGDFGSQSVAAVSLMQIDLPECCIAAADDEEFRQAHDAGMQAWRWKTDTPLTPEGLHRMLSSPPR